MALVKENLEKAILSAMKKAKESGSDFEEQFASDLAKAIHNYLLKATVNTSVTVATTGTATAQGGGGTGQGKLS